MRYVFLIQGVIYLKCFTRKLLSSFLICTLSVSGCSAYKTEQPSVTEQTESANEVKTKTSEVKTAILDKSDSKSMELPPTTEQTKATTEVTTETSTVKTAASETDEERFRRFYPAVWSAYENIISGETSTDNSMQEVISLLMDKNLICIYTYFTTALFRSQDTSLNYDGYSPIEFWFFKDLSDFYTLVESTYIEKTVNELIQGHKDTGEALFIEKDGMTMYNPNNTLFTTGPYFSDLGYEIEITDQSDTLCKFLYKPIFETLSDEEYNQISEYWGNDILQPYECEIVFENGEWKLGYMVFAF